MPLFTLEGADREPVYVNPFTVLGARAQNLRGAPTKITLIGEKVVVVTEALTDVARQIQEELR